MNMTERKIEVIPAVMPESYDDLRRKVNQVKGAVQTVQIDVMDGVFVPEKTWPYKDGDEDTPEELIRTERFLPDWERVAYEVDLMVEEPEKVIDTWLSLGVRRVIVHVESTKELPAIIKKFEARDQSQWEVLPVELGVALDIETPNNAVLRHMHDIDFVQCMGIDQIGYQGQPFDDRVLEKVRDLRWECPHLIISVDGGVSFESAPRLIKAGAQRLVSGSTIFNSNNVRVAVERLASRL